MQGDYTRYTFDITGLLQRGVNTLALEVYPNNPNTMFTLDNVDWTQIPPDNNTGIQFPIQLHTSGPLALSNAHVVQDDAADLSTAALTVKADVTNHAATRADRRRCRPPSRRPPAANDPRHPDGDGRGAERRRRSRSRPSDDPRLNDPSPERVVAVRHGRASRSTACGRR